MELEIDIKLSNGNPGKYDPDKKAVTRSFNFGLPWDSRDHEGEMRLIEAVSASVNFADIIGMMCEELNEQDFPEDMGVPPKELNELGDEVQRAMNPPADPFEVIHPEHNPAADVEEIPTGDQQ